MRGRKDLRLGSRNLHEVPEDWYWVLEYKSDFVLEIDADAFVRQLSHQPLFIAGRVTAKKDKRTGCGFAVQILFEDLPGNEERLRMVLDGALKHVVVPPTLLDEIRRGLWRTREM